MYEPDQTFIADSFMALYTANGRPTGSRQEVAARYEFCEDMASQVGEMCRMLQFSTDVSESTALRKCLDGLLAPPASVSADEATWVMRRVAELLDWHLPVWLMPAASPAR